MTSNQEEKTTLDSKHVAKFSTNFPLEFRGTAASIRPSGIRHVTAPAYESPLRHHHRQHSSAKQVKETLHARSEYTNSEDDGGSAVHRINQYQIKQEIGRGSFGAVHLAVDQHGTEYAVKEFSKSRLRKRAQSNILRRPGLGRRPGQLAAGLGFNSPLHHHSASDIHDQEGGGDPLYLIKEEIAIMKKLNHQNLVSLIEVLDDPTEDSLYMVLEMCKKGVVMKVGMDEKAKPHDEESCRCWFRDLILGIEYLHAQGVVHRDIKPDNLLLTEDDILKIVDFGVSEMFEKSSEMLTSKSAGSPAFLPPELCVAKHGDISGKAADIWSMGVTLYCLRYGKIPFEEYGVLQLYESIKNDEVDLSSEQDNDFKDLMLSILEKDPSKRIKMPELREHPWVTKRGADPLLSTEENTRNLVEPPTEEETNQAITSNLSNILVLMKAVKRFKRLIAYKRPHLIEGILGGESRMVQPPLALSRSEKHHHQKARSVESHDRHPIEGPLAAGGVHRDIDLSNFNDSIGAGNENAVITSPTGPSNRPESPLPFEKTAPTSPSLGGPSQPLPIPGSPRLKDHSGKGQADDHFAGYLFLAIGPRGDGPPPDPPAVSESPPAAEINIYETAYHSEVVKIRERRGQEAKYYLTRRVDQKSEYRKDGNVVGVDPDTGKSGFAHVLEVARGKDKKPEAVDVEGSDASASTGAVKLETGLARISDFVQKLKAGDSEDKSDEAVGDENAGNGNGHGGNASTGNLRGESGLSRLFDRVKSGLEKKTKDDLGKETKDEAENFDGISKDDGANAGASSSIDGLRTGI